MDNNQLAKALQDIAQGNMFSMEALQAAYNHDIATSNDKQVIMRYLYGTSTDTDHIRLQEIAMYINEA